jgi:pimeloyl-ACP methyl ester carboxylesterase
MEHDAAVEWVASFTADDWAAAEASRHERWPGEADLATDALVNGDFPKVVVRGGWRGDPNAARRAVSIAKALAEAIAADVVVFDEATHYVQLEAADEFNRLLQTTWEAGDGKRAACR